MNLYQRGEISSIDFYMVIETKDPAAADCQNLSALVWLSCGCENNQDETWT